MLVKKLLSGEGDWELYPCRDVPPDPARYRSLQELSLVWGVMGGMRAKTFIRIYPPLEVAMPVAGLLKAAWE